MNAFIVIFLLRSSLESSRRVWCNFSPHSSHQMIRRGGTGWIQRSHQLSYVPLRALSLGACRWEVYVLWLIFRSTHLGTHRWKEFKKNIIAAWDLARIWRLVHSRLLKINMIFDSSPRWDYKVMFSVRAIVFSCQQAYIFSFLCMRSNHRNMRSAENNLCCRFSCWLCFALSMCDHRLFLAQLACLYWVTVQLFYTSQIEWKQDSLQGEPCLAQPFLFKGLLWVWGQLVSCRLCVCKRLWCWISRAFLLAWKDSV